MHFMILSVSKFLPLKSRGYNTVIAVVTTSKGKLQLSSVRIPASVNPCADRDGKELNPFNDDHR